MSQGLVKHESLIASPGLSSTPFQTREPNSTGQSTSWADTHIPSTSKMESHESFSLSLGSTMQMDDNELRLGGFSQGGGLVNTDHWSRFSSRGAQAPPQVLPSFSFRAVSVSPDTRLSTTPHSLPDHLRGPVSETLQGHVPESFQNALHGPVPNPQVPHALDASGADMTFSSFGNTREDGQWLKNFDEYPGSKPFGLHLPHPIAGGASTTRSGLSSSLATSGTLPLPEQTYLHHQHSHPGIFPHSHSFPGSDRALFKSSQLTPPSTASSSSGSSSPFLKSDIFETTTRKDTTWKHFDANANVFRSAPIQHSDSFVSKPSHAAQNWKAETCDPRGIIGKRERSDSRMHGNAYGDTMIPMPCHSPAISDLSGSSTSGERVDGAGRQSRHSDFGPGMNPYGLLPILSKDGGGGTDAQLRMAHKVKKKSGEEMLGMGLEDVDERALQFTSRQDTKPTRLLRRQCFNCRTWRDVSAWRRSIMQAGYIVCNKCGLYEKAHRKPRPLNDRGEFVRPTKHVTKVSVPHGRVLGRVRSTSEHANGHSIAVMRLDEDRPASTHQV